MLQNVKLKTRNACVGFEVLTAVAMKVSFFCRVVCINGACITSIFRIGNQPIKNPVGLERGPLSLVRMNEELLERKSSGSGLEN
jgi:hypothetical protein